MDSEDFPLFFRNEPLHLLDVLSVSDEEDELLSSIPPTWRENVSLVHYRSNSSLGTILGEEPAFDRHAKSFASSCNAYSLSCSSGISASLLLKFITNYVIHEKF